MKFRIYNFIEFVQEFMRFFFHFDEFMLPLGKILDFFIACLWIYEIFHTLQSLSRLRPFQLGNLLWQILLAVSQCTCYLEIFPMLSLCWRHFPCPKLHKSSAIELSKWTLLIRNNSAAVATTTAALRSIGKTFLPSLLLLCRR